VDDREDAPHATGDIESFIRGAKVVQIAKAASPAEAER